MIPSIQKAQSSCQTTDGGQEGEVLPFLLAEVLCSA